ncbi:MAG: PSD1 and planctomycete cytochrome C domain-containing protein [Terriglobia bacterium]
MSTWALRHRMAHGQVDFSRDIQPILNQNCVHCHGGVRQKNGVSFIFREEALGVGKSGRRTIVPGKPNASELMARLTSADPEARMPYHAPPLSPEQISLFRQWIKEGAKWTDHWAFVAPVPQPLPAVKRVDWVRQPLDRFILARLEKEAIEPSAEADKATLLRRVSFDLTGLPPTAEEQAAFLADPAPDAYEKQVARLLNSPRYGERWASMWLDLARYADTMGYEKDQARPGVWPYRDWVIDAFNRNLPYDRFVIKQLAGDLLPNATLEDRIATSFHRQTPNNEEGGTDDEEFRLVAVMDRVATTWSVLNGLTMNCVQCHSHPYDPIRHTDYYKSLAFFNTQDDADLNDDSPNLTVPIDKARYSQAEQIQSEIAKLLHAVENSDRQVADNAHWKQLPIQNAEANELSALEPLLPDLKQKLAKAQQDYKKMPGKEKAGDIDDLREAIAETQSRLAHARAAGPAKTFRIQNGEALTNSTAPPQFFYELTANADLPLLTAIRIEVPPIDADKARHTPEDGFIVDKVEVSVMQPGGKQSPVPFRYFVQDSETNLASAVSAANDSKDKAKGTDPVPSAFSALPKLFRTRWIVGVPSAPLAIAPGSRIKVALKQTREIDDKPALIQRVRLSASGDPSWTALAQDPVRDQSIARLKQLESELAAIPSVQLPVMVEERPYEQRATREFERGNFLTKVGPDLAPDVPAIFPSLPAGAPRDRLTLAKWFFMPGQPLTARVAVNRYWEELFGTGIVETLENFGSVGEPPSHPELLDWLALHFQNDLHWDTKALLREMVTSATYRQSAAATAALTAKDPRNRLLAHGPQQRLTAEMVRDQALVASGLLSTAMGGPPVMPPQPAGIWNSVYNDSQWRDATGPNRYRRAVYTYIKRTSGYPSFLMFDASDRDTSLPRRIPTNTPLQALVTLNDPVYQEAAEALARRVVKETKTSEEGSSADVFDARLAYETRLVLSRDPTAREMSVLRAFYQQALATPQRPAFMNVSLNVPGKSLGKEGSGRELDALTAVGSVLFNLDAALTR